MWEVANGKILIFLFTSWLIINSYSSMKLTRNKPFRLYFIEKMIQRGGLIERDLREVIRN